MTIHTEIPPEEVNYSKEHPLKDFLILLAGIFGIISILFLILGTLAVYLTRNMPTSLENKIGTLFEKAFEGDESQNLPARQKINEIAQQLTHQNLSTHPQVSFKIQCSKDKNAFALPGGKIILLSGLLKTLPNTESLAMLMGHEMGHIVHRDHLAQFGRGLVFATLIAVVSGGTDSDSAKVLVNFLGETFMNQFSREQEMAADRFGLELVHQAGFNPQAALGLYDALQGGTEIPEFFSTHPGLENRKADLEQLIRGWSEKFPDSHPLPTEFKDLCGK